MPTEIVVCRAGKVFSWDDPEQICLFETDLGYFTRKTKDIPWQVQSAVDSFGTVEAEVDPEPDDLGHIRLIKFVV